MATDKPKVSVILDTETYERICELAEKESRTKSSQIAHMVKQQLQQEDGKTK